MLCILMPLNQKVAVITGSSSGIGWEITLVLAKNRFIVCVTMRNLQRSFELKSMADKEKLLSSLRFV